MYNTAYFDKRFHKKFCKTLLTINFTMSNRHKVPLGRPRRRREDNIKMDLWEVGCDPRDWIGIAEDRDQWLAYVRTVMNLRVASKSFS